MHSVKLKRRTRDAGVFNLPVYKASAMVLQASDAGVLEKVSIKTRSSLGCRKERKGIRRVRQSGMPLGTFRSHRSQKENRLTERKYTDIYEGRDIGANLREIIIYRATRVLLPAFNHTTKGKSILTELTPTARTPLPFRCIFLLIRRSSSPQRTYRALGLDICIPDRISFPSKDYCSLNVSTIFYVVAVFEKKRKIKTKMLKN